MKATLRYATLLCCLLALSACNAKGQTTVKTYGYKVE